MSYWQQEFQVSDDFSQNFQKSTKVFGNSRKIMTDLVLVHVTSLWCIIFSILESYFFVVAISVQGF